MVNKIFVASTYKSIFHFFFNEGTPFLSPSTLRAMSSNSPVQDPSLSFDLKKDSLLSFISTTREFVKELSEYSKSKVAFYLPPLNSCHSCKILKFSNYSSPLLLSQKGSSSRSLPTSSNSYELNQQLDEISQHLSRLSTRLSTNTSKILVTGDLNAGKSTFINTLLGGQHILSTDQQPCTMAFCEVTQIPQSSSSPQFITHTEGETQFPDIMVHAYTKDHNEEAEDGHSSSFVSMTLEDMQKLSSDPETPYTWYRIWYPSNSIHSKDSLWSLGHDFTYSLIDSPGLNTDFLKTMSLFTKQEDIDVVVFVINAANHLTLSAREFLLEAAKEKSLVFTVVNRMDDIKDKERCKRIILSQIREVLPFTFEAHSDLIHFVSAIQQFADMQSSINSISNKQNDSLPENQRNWIHLTESLRKFVFEKRTQSKLFPAKTFLLNLFDDLSAILSYNKSVYDEKYQSVNMELATSEPEWEKLVTSQEKLIDILNELVDSCCLEIYSKARTRLVHFTTSIESVVNSLEWSGFSSIRGFVQNVESELKRKAHHEMLECRTEALEITTNAIYSLFKSAQSFLPQIFIPQVTTTSTSPSTHPDVASILSNADPIIYKDTLKLSTLDAITNSFCSPLCSFDWVAKMINSIPIIGSVSSILSCSKLFAPFQQSSPIRWIRIVLFAGIGIAGIRWVAKPVWNAVSFIPMGRVLLCCGGIFWACSSIATPSSIRRSLIQQAEFHYSTIGTCNSFTSSPTTSSTPPVPCIPIESQLAIVEQFPRLLEGSSRKVLRVPCNDLIARWHSWMTRSQTARQEREGLRKRFASTVEYFEHTRCSLISFRRSVESVSL